MARFVGEIPAVGHRKRRETRVRFGSSHGGGLPSQATSREQRVLALVAEGLPTREIGDELHYSERTVKQVLDDVVVKLGARSRSQAVARAVRQGII